MPDETHSHPKDPSEDPKVVYPDFIYTDDKVEHPFEEQQPQDNPASESAANWIKNKNTLTLRFICLLFFICCLIFALGLVVGTGLLGAIALLFLFRNRPLNKVFFLYLKLLTNTLIAAAGCLLGVLSPTLGFAFLFIYFSVNDPSKLYESIMQRTFKK